ncbi:J domain-containing protein [Penicillium diatomitis]|uniref:J domain-containing protein n=1 Tax=Penicillium diatomitis TaxID=2819901 RepID=A0A9W9X605_9EURO|nr:J domain-containing protein [Penicillium diatomitis]KAJ5485034.1 J domain-containing protein [Penicillium diatomitis]
MPSATASGSDAKGGSARSREHNQGNQDRAYTPEQKAAVLRIRKCGPTDFYEILAIEKTATDSEIKKAYRKLSLLTHPDKNSYDGADEAFKMVSRAFQILSDSDKKSRYDRFGGDPESRFNPGPSASSGGSPFSGFNGGGGFPRSAGGGAAFDAEISPEEMFNRFFNGGFGGGGFGPFAGPQFVFNMGGGPGFRVHQFGGGVPRRRPRPTAGNNNNEPETPMDGWGFVRQLLPLILLFVLPLLSSLLTGSSTPAGPTYRFDSPVSPHTMGRTTPRLNLNYFVNPVDVEDYSARKFRQLDQRVEVDYIARLRHDCESEVHMRERMIQEAQGWFFPDVEKMKEARALELKHCRRLEQLKGKY